MRDIGRFHDTQLSLSHHISNNIRFQIGNTVFSGDVILLMHDCVLDNLPACKGIFKKILHLTGRQIHLKLGQEFFASGLIMLYYTAVYDQTSNTTVAQTAYQEAK